MSRLITLPRRTPESPPITPAPCSPLRPQDGTGGSSRLSMAIFNGMAAMAGVIAPLLSFVLASAGGADGRPLCCNDPDTAVVRGAEAGVWALIAVTLLAQAAFGVFFLRLRQRLRLVRDPLPRPAFRLIQGGASSEVETAARAASGGGVPPRNRDDAPPGDLVRRTSDPVSAHHDGGAAAEVLRDAGDGTSAPPDWLVMLHQLQRQIARFLREYPSSASSAPTTLRAIAASTRALEDAEALWARAVRDLQIDEATIAASIGDDCLTKP